MFDTAIDGVQANGFEIEALRGTGAPNAVKRAFRLNLLAAGQLHLHLFAEVVVEPLEAADGSVAPARRLSRRRRLLFAVAVNVLVLVSARANRVPCRPSTMKMPGNAPGSQPSPPPWTDGNGIVAPPQVPESRW